MEPTDKQLFDLHTLLEKNLKPACKKAKDGLVSLQAEVKTNKLQIAKSKKAQASVLADRTFKNFLAWQGKLQVVEGDWKRVPVNINQLKASKNKAAVSLLKDCQVVMTTLTELEKQADLLKKACFGLLTDVKATPA